MPTGALEKRVVNYLVLSASAIAILLGTIILYVASKDSLFATHPNVREVTREIGAFTVVSGLLTIFWELVAKRAFADELLAKVRISRDLVTAGILGITPNFHRDIDWSKLFKNARELDVFFAYGGTWRNSHIQDLQELLKRSDAQLRIVLPDRDEFATIADLAPRFNYTTQQLSQYIADSENAFRALATAPECRGKVEIWLLARTPVFSLYRFDDICVAALYNHRRNRDGVPAFTMERGGTLYEFFTAEFNAMLDPNVGGARRVFSNRGDS